jgi:predicted DNA-binding transcriptional regulator AlpA
VSDLASLHPDDLASLARLVAAEVADRVSVNLVEIVRAELRQAISEAGDTASSGRLLTAEEVARLVGLSRGAVYRRSEEFGAVRIGKGPRPRLRFELEEVIEALAACSTGRGSDTAKPARQAAKRRRGVAEVREKFPLLPVRGLE